MIIFTTLPVFAEDDYVNYAGEDFDAIDDRPVLDSNNILYQFVNGYATKSGKWDAITYGTGKLYEDYSSTKSENGYYDVVVHRENFTKNRDDYDFSVRYNWVHAVYYLTKYINSDVDYTTLKEKNESKWIKEANKWIREGMDELNTYKAKDATNIEYQKEIDAGEVYVKKRAANVIKNVTGMSKENFKKEINKAIKELNAAYDLSTGKSSKQESNVDINHSFEEKMAYEDWQIKSIMHGMVKDIILVVNKEKN